MKIPRLLSNIGWLILIAATIGGLLAFYARIIKPYIINPLIESL